MRNHRIVMPVIILAVFGIAVDIQGQKNADRYLDFAEASANWTFEHLDSLTEMWRSTIDPNSVFGYRPPSRLLETATIYAHLYQIKGKRSYAKRAREILLAYEGYRDEYPKWAADKRPDYTQGTPALPDFFTAQRFIRPYEILKEGGFFSEAENNQLSDVIAQSMNYLLQSQEWGAMNRAALRAETLAWALRTLPNHPDAETWHMYEQALINDNWGNWQIEDASHYNAIWLYALIGYGYATDQLQKLFQEPEMFYYSRFYLELICPDYMVPDYGDSYWESNWSRWLVYFETAAAVYQSAQHKWVANRLAEKYIKWDQVQGIGLAYILLDCYLLGDHDLAGIMPSSQSMEVMDDVVGKKVVMRSGWEPADSYLLINYKDEGEAGYLSRYFLRDGIVVEEEKMTHGHADENSIPLLMNQGAILLHDGGYRDFMPSGPYGAYRQDYFHNRMCVRPEKIFFGQKEGEFRYSLTDHPAIPGQGVMDFLRNSGAYKAVQTQRIDFLTFSDFDYSRTRIIDKNLGYESDRVVIWLKEPNCFVVVDIVKATQVTFLTGANLWFTRKIFDQGENWYDTGYDSLRNLDVSSDQRLLIHFPRPHYRFYKTEKVSRYWQQELLISEYSGQFFELGQTVAFATILYPHHKGIHPKTLVDLIELKMSDEDDNGICLVINHDDAEYQVGIKCDLRKEMIRDFRRPKYTYESGRVSYGDMESNSDFFYVKEQKDLINYTLVNVSRAVYKQQELFSQKPNYFGLAFDGSGDVTGISKARYWRKEIEK